MNTFLYDLVEGIVIGFTSFLLVILTIFSMDYIMERLCCQCGRRMSVTQQFDGFRLLLCPACSKLGKWRIVDVSASGSEAAAAA